MTRRDNLALKDYRGHIRLAITRIERYVAGVDQAAFIANEEKPDAVIRNLEIIGEAAGNIERHFPDFADQHPRSSLKGGLRHTQCPDTWLLRG